MTFNTDFTIDYPSELSLEIFSKCDVQTLGRCNQVNKTWNVLTNDISLWKVISEKFFPNIELPKNCENIKEFLHAFYPKSEEELLDRLGDFLQKVQLNQSAIFTCKLRSTKDLIFKVVLSYTIDNPKPDLIKEYFFAKNKNIKKDSDLSIMRSTKNNYYFRREDRWKISVFESDEFKQKVRKKIQNRVKELDQEVNNL